LGEGFLTKITLVRSYACMGSRVPLQIKCVVESLAAECAEVPLGVAVALHVPVQKTLQAERFATHATRELARVRLTPEGRQLLRLLLLGHIGHHGILNAVTTVNQLQGSVGGDSKPLLENLNAHLEGRNIHQIFLVIG